MKKIIIGIIIGIISTIIIGVIAILIYFKFYAFVPDKDGMVYEGIKTYEDTIELTGNEMEVKDISIYN